MCRFDYSLNVGRERMFDKFISISALYVQHTCFSTKKVESKASVKILAVGIKAMNEINWLWLRSSKSSYNLQSCMCINEEVQCDKGYEKEVGLIDHESRIKDDVQYDEDIR